MDITRHNYEEYFILYVDNELNAAERHAVEAFVQQNPDLEEELIMLQQSVLRPDEKLVFARKENLLKDTTSQGLVNENNYEQYFVLYGDDELTNKEKDLVEQFVYKYPQYQVEFELIQQARLFPDQSLGFPDKAYLYRTEEDDHKVVPFAWWRIAAAAIFLIAVGSLGLYIVTSDNKQTDGIPVVKTTAPDSNNTVAQNKNEVKDQQPVVKTVEPKMADEQVVRVSEQTAQSATASVKTEKKSNNTSNISKQVSVTPKSGQQVIAKAPVPEINDSHLTAKSVDVAVASHATVKPITVENISSKAAPVTTAIAVAMPEETNEDKTYVLNTSVNKTPLRGFFRKVSRVVDKATSSDTDENRKGSVRIANFAIALK
jgi:hypothetical protein